MGIYQKNSKAPDEQFFGGEDWRVLYRVGTCIGWHLGW